MELTLEIGWWVIPAIVSALSFIIAILKFVPPGAYGDGEILNLSFLMTAYVVSMIVLLICALAI